MVRARLTSKGQITVPIEIRRRYGLDTGSEVDFVAEAAGPRLVPVKRRKLLDLYGALPVSRPDIGIGEMRRVAGRKRGEQLVRRARRA